MPPDREETTGETGELDLTGGTGLPPRCDVPETEPNDTLLEPNILPANDEGCGDFTQEGDLDNWLVHLEEDAWLEVRLEAANASLSDVALLMAGQQTGVAVARDDDFEDSDVHMLFPAPADDYILTVREQQAKAGDRYAYNVRATVSKAPLFFDVDGNVLDWTEEVEPNDDIALAPSLRDGDAILGFSDQPFDIDWYKLGIPAGKHALRFEIQAYLQGSGGNYTLVLFNEDLEQIKVAYTGEVGAEPDPVLKYNSTGDEVVYLQVREADSKGNVAIWYLLETSVVAE